MRQSRPFSLSLSLFLSVYMNCAITITSVYQQQTRLCAKMCDICNFKRRMTVNPS